MTAPTSSTTSAVTPDPLWSYALAAVGILGIWLAGRRSWTGWAVGFAAQALWIVYALATRQYGFILSALAYGAIYARNWWKWTHPKPEVVDTP